MGLQFPLGSFLQVVRFLFLGAILVLWPVARADNFTNCLHAFLQHRIDVEKFEVAIRPWLVRSLVMIFLFLVSVSAPSGLSIPFQCNPNHPFPLPHSKKLNLCDI
jgi:hypothetical protein